MPIYIYDDWHFERDLADGTTDTLLLGGKFKLGRVEGTASISTEYEVQRAPQGDGVRVLGHYIPERPLNFVILSTDNATEEERDVAKRRVLEYVRPNLYKPVRAIVTYVTGQRYAIDIRPGEGAVFSPDAFAGTSFQDSLSFIAHHPIWYDPDTIEYSITQEDISNIIITVPRFKFPTPVTFSVVFGPKGRPFTTEDIEYAGSYEAHPKITLTGPFGGVRIENTGTLTHFSLLYEVYEDDKRIIEYNQERRGWEIKNAMGEDRRYELSLDSNLADFAIVPSDHLQYDQKISALFTGITTDTAMKVEHNPRYVSI